jgi:hypothetical protein
MRWNRGDRNFGVGQQCAEPPVSTLLLVMLVRVSTAFENGELPGQQFQGGKGDGDPLLQKAATVRGHIGLSQVPGDPTPRWVKEPLPEQTYRICYRCCGRAPPGGDSAEGIRKRGAPLPPDQPPAIIASFGERELISRQDGLTFLGGEWPPVVRWSIPRWVTAYFPVFFNVSMAARRSGRASTAMVHSPSRHD